MAEWKMHHAPGKVVNGKKLRQLREAKGWTQEEFATRCDMTGHNIGRIEAGDGNTSTGKVRSMADALGVNPAILIFGVDELVNDAVSQATKNRPQPSDPTPSAALAPNRDVSLLRAFAGKSPAYIHMGSLKTDVPEEILGEILHIVAVHKMKSSG